MKLLIVGNPDSVHVGAHFLSAAKQLSVEASILDVRRAWSKNRWLRGWYWRICGHRPTFLYRFSTMVVNECRRVHPELVLSTGPSPLTNGALASMRRLGIKTVNFSTDDPWNKTHMSKWFLQALPEYDTVYTPRRATIPEMLTLGCTRVEYLPFAYSTKIHYREDPLLRKATAHEPTGHVLFAGGADPDRIPWIHALIKAKLIPVLYGNGWEKSRLLRPYHHGMADPKTLRAASQRIPITLGLVRRANRDDHSMRSYEAPAMGACVLAELTPDHLALFGNDGEATRYFSTVEEMVRRVNWTLDHPKDRIRMRHNLHERLTRGQNTYSDRLRIILRENLNTL